MGRTAIIIGVAYAAVCVVGGLLVLGVAVSTKLRGESDTRRLAEREKTWFVIVIGLLTALLFGTIFFTPYGRSARSDAQVVHVTAQQFFWGGLDKPVKANRQVEFRVTSTDVNHEFAVYTESWRLLFQVQVVPGEEARYVYTFRRPGTYRVVCLEFCGVNHHKMLQTLEVVS